MSVEIKLMVTFYIHILLDWLLNQFRDEIHFTYLRRLNVKSFRLWISLPVEWSLRRRRVEIN